MDDPACDTAALWRTLDQFGSLNRQVSRYRSILSTWVLDDMARTDAQRHWRLVDIGAGGCDIAVWILGAARRRGLSLSVTAIDNDPRVIAYARQRHGRQPGLDIQHADLSDMSTVGPFDYLFANHVLHHLPDDVIPSTLATMQSVVGRRWIISDLHRSRWAYLGFQILGLGYRNGFAAEDGLRSIRRGFTETDLRGYLNIAKLDQTVILRHYVPARLCLIGTGNQGNPKGVNRLSAL